MAGPFPCNSYIYQIEYDGANTLLYEVDIVVGSMNLINPNIGFNTDAIAYNVADDLLYAFDSTTAELFTIDNAGTSSSLGFITNLPAPANYDVIGIDNNGYLYVTTTGTTTYYTIDLNAGPTYLDLVDAQSGYILDVFPYGNSTIGLTTIDANDMAYNPIYNYFYYVDSATGDVTTFLPTSGGITPLTTTGLAATSIDGIYIDSLGNIYVYDDTTNDIYRVTADLSAANGVVLTSGFIPTDTFADWAGCMNAIISYVDLAVVKTDSIEYVSIGDDVSYVISITNNGTIDAENVELVDILDPAFAYQAGSLKINGVDSGDDLTSVSLPDIAPGATVTVTFSATVVGLPAINPVSNVATINYEFDDGFGSTQSGTENSNITTTEVYYADLISTANFVKSVSDNLVTIGDTITYTIYVYNSGNTLADNIVVADTLPAEVSYVPGTMLIGGVPDASLPGSISLPAPLLAGAAVIITFDVTVDSYPPSGTLVNYADITYDYTVDPLNILGESESGTSNSVETDVVFVDLSSITKSQSDDYAAIGDEITYSITFTNDGNVDANNVVLTDIDPAGTTFVAGSVKIDGVDAALEDPNLGIPIGTVVPGQTVTVTFKVLVTSDPGGTIDNDATVDYTFTTDDLNPDSESGSETSNTTSADFVDLDVDVVKSADKLTTTTGDIITYTIVISNNGTVDIDDVLLTDPLSDDVEFVEDSVEIDGTPEAGEDPTVGIDLGTITAGTSVEVTFEVEVISTEEGTIDNQATIEFEYIPALGADPEFDTEDSNLLSIPNLVANLTMVKSTDKTVAILGEVITFTITITNDGDFDATDIIVTDTLDPEFEYIGNVTIDGVPNAGDITAGINVGDLAVGESVVITFEAKIVIMPGDGVVSNYAEAEYLYDNGLTPLALTRAIVGTTSTSNVVNIVVLESSVDIYKRSSRQVIIVGEQATYTIEIINNGYPDVVDMILTDILPPELLVIDITIDGVSVVGDLVAGIPLGPLPAGSSRIVTIVVEGVNTLLDYINRVDVEVEFEPVVGEPPSFIDIFALDAAGMSVVEPYLSLIKSPDVTDAVIGQVVPYTLRVENTGNITLNDVVVGDILPIDLEYVPGSLKVDGVKVLTQDIVSGVNLGTLIPGQIKVVTFDLLIVGNSVNPIVNRSYGLFNYDTEDLVSPEYGRVVSNDAVINVYEAYLQLTKSADKTEIKIGETVQYTITLTNAGDTELINVIFRDELPCLLTFVRGSFSINGVSYGIQQINLLKGINIGSMQPGEVITIVFDAYLRGTSCTYNKESRLDNIANASYIYILPNGTTETKRTGDVINSIYKVK